MTDPTGHGASTDEPDQPGPCAYTVRYSARAKHARITVTPYDGVVVIIPQGQELDAACAVAERREWIEQTLSEFAEQRAAHLADPAALLPVNVHFPLTGERWSVLYRPTSASGVRVLGHGSDTIIVLGQTEDAEACLKALQRWLHRRARERLLPLLDQAAAGTGLRPTRASIRAQRYRWGGCSKGGHVTLNRALVFLDAELVWAAIRHELAHVAHPNHSKEFWRLLEALDSESAGHHERLRRQNGTIPAWVERY